MTKEQTDAQTCASYIRIPYFRIFLKLILTFELAASNSIDL